MKEERETLIIKLTIFVSLLFMIIFPLCIFGHKYESDLGTHYWLTEQIMFTHHWLPNMLPSSFIGFLYAPYAYTPGWHMNVAMSSMLSNISVLESMQIVQIVLTVATLVNVYILSKELYGHKPALYAVLLLCTAPFYVYRSSLFCLLPRNPEIFLFSTILMLWILSYSRKDVKYALISLIPLLASLFVHRSAIFNFAIPLSFVGFHFFKSENMLKKGVGIASILFSISIIVVPLYLYTTTTDHLKLMASASVKLGLLTPLMLLAVYHWKKDKMMDRLISPPVIVIGLCFLIMSFVVYRPALFASVCIAPIAGMYIERIIQKNPSYKSKLCAAIVILCVLSSSVGLTFYSTKWTSTYRFSQADSVDEYLQSQYTSGYAVSYVRNEFHVPSYFGGYGNTYIYHYPNSFHAQAILYLEGGPGPFDERMDDILRGSYNFAHFPNTIKSNIYRDPSLASKYKATWAIVDAQSDEKFAKHKLPKVYASNDYSVIRLYGIEDELKGDYILETHPFYERVKEIIDSHAVEKYNYLYKYIERFMEK